MSFEFDVPPAIRRAIAVLLALLPLALVAMALYVTMAGIFVQRERVAQLKRESAAYEALLRDAPHWNTEFARLRGMEAGGALTFAGRRVDANARVMQARISTLVTAAGGSDVQSTIEVRANGDDGPTEMRATVSFNANMSSIANALYRLRTARPVLVVGRISIQSAPASQPRPLRVILVVSGFAGAA